MNEAKTLAELLANLANDMQANIGAAPPHIEIDTPNIVRFDIEKPKDKLGFYRAFSHHVGGYYYLNAFYGNYKTTGKEGIKWRSHQPSELSKHDLTVIRQQQSIQAARAKVQQQQAQESARIKAVNWWEGATEAKANHPYLVKKQVSTMQALRQYRHWLLVPLVDIGGYLRNLQTIAPNGTKRFLKSGIKKGMFSPIGLSSGEHECLYLCEGWATGASIYEAYNQPVICAMDAGNLLPVAKALRTKYPELPITLIADNDRKTAVKIGVNVGLSHAKTVAESVSNIKVVIPQFPPHAPLELSDFNDAILFYRGHWEYAL